ncbi:ABC transporter substrate-binding protein [Pollutimonas bauzanensis]|uniref:NitT/TauT family transport system substrate-binding protein n=1 Tax=Pollutimonas bauzanensis TaxID=658167 RepID=A0A1M5QRL4_9BURK|nr:ABC transporter substrate-binding protein [Pollutimonas bauzanensis]SHH16764.1 NitT/TauT family transport system substrate-binding protein [Pollutimonas bauzanensis]
MFRPLLKALLLGALCMAAASLPARAARYEKLTLAGPTAVVTFPLLHMVETQALKQYTDKLEFRLWQNPDQLRVLLAKKEIDFSAAPSNLPALMANRGDPVRLLNISVWGILWLVSRDPAVHGFADLAGKELLVPFQRDLPAVLLDTLLQAQALPPEKAVRLRRTRDSQDAIALMLTGQGQHALLVEPTASLLMWRNQQQGGAPLYRAQSLEAAWRASFPGQADLPQAGIMVNSHLAHDIALSRAVDQAYADSAAWCSSHPRDCAELVHRHIPHLPVAAIEDAIEVTRLDSRPANTIRPQLEALYRLLGEQHPQAIGGRLPDADFYGP